MTNSDSLIKCTDILIKRNLTIAFAESATAGRMAAEFSLVRDAGKFLKGALVCYDATLKSDLLNVPKDMLEICTPESMEVTQAITKGLESVIKADIHIGVTGLTTSGGSESDEKPVGTMFIHCRYLSTTLFSERTVFKGNPEDIILQTIKHTASLLCLHLKTLFAT